MTVATASALLWSATQQEEVMFLLKAASLVSVTALNILLAYRHYRNRNSKP